MLNEVIVLTSLGPARYVIRANGCDVGFAYDVIVTCVGSTVARDSNESVRILKELLFLSALSLSQNMTGRPNTATLIAK